MSNVHLDARFLKTEIARLLEAYPELAEDEQLRADTLEGETNVVPFISHILSQRQDAVSMQEAIAARIGELSERRDRYGRRADALKSLIQSVMDAAGLSKLELPEATLSITKPRTSVEVLDVTELPQGYFKLERKADKAAIKKSLEAGEQIPGAELVFGEPSLTVRTK